MDFAGGRVVPVTAAFSALAFVVLVALRRTYDLARRLDWLVGICVKENEGKVGLDISHNGERAYSKCDHNDKENRGNHSSREIEPSK